MSEACAELLPAPEHPWLAQLSALHHFRTYADIAIVVVVLALTNLLAHFTTPWANIAVVPAAAIGLLALVRFHGLGWSEMGLGREHWRSGFGYALAAVTVVGSVIAIGNAPTALFRLLEMLDAGAPAPAAVIGLPVGFVGAMESKEALAAHGRVPFLIVRGRKGGSAMAAAAVNALASERE